MKIERVHVRFEDAYSVPEFPLAFGVTTASISVLTTDEEWRATRSDPEAIIIHKVKWQ